MTQLPKWCKKGLHLLFSCLRVDNKRGFLSDFAKNPTFLASFIDADSEGDAPEYSKGILPVLLSMLLKSARIQLFWKLHLIGLRTVISFFSLSRSHFRDA